MLMTGIVWLDLTLSGLALVAIGVAIILGQKEYNKEHGIKNTSMLTFFKRHK